jgi:hypothetical protein
MYSKIYTEEMVKWEGFYLFVQTTPNLNYKKSAVLFNNINLFGVTLFCSKNDQVKTNKTHFFCFFHPLCTLGIKLYRF